jgi:hypothetical protein
MCSSFVDSAIPEFTTLQASSRRSVIRPKVSYVSFDGDSDGLLVEGTTLANLSGDDIAFA